MKKKGSNQEKEGPLSNVGLEAPWLMLSGKDR